MITPRICLLLLALCLLSPSYAADEIVTTTTTTSAPTEQPTTPLPVEEKKLTPCEIYQKIQFKMSLDQVKEAIGKENAAAITVIGKTVQWSSHVGILDMSLDFLNDGTYMTGSFPTKGLNQNEQFVVDLAKDKKITVARAEELLGKSGNPAGTIYRLTFPDNKSITINTDIDGKVNGVTTDLYCVDIPLSS